MAPTDEDFRPDLPPESPLPANPALRERHLRILAEGVADLELSLARHRRWLRFIAIACLFPPTVMLLITVWFFGRAALRAHWRSLLGTLDLWAPQLDPVDVAELSQRLDRLRL
jgi:hypothetical protein